MTRVVRFDEDVKTQESDCKSPSEINLIIAQIESFLLVIVQNVSSDDSDKKLRHTILSELIELKMVWDVIAEMKFLMNL